MNEIIIPTAVNWFNDNILSTTADGSKVAYGSKNEIFVLSNLNQDPADVSKYDTKIYPIGVKNMISAVQFAPVSNEHAYSGYLASAGNDGKVRVWNFKDSTIVSYHTGHMSPKGNEEIRGMDWSTLDPELIVTVASSGSIVLWKLNVNVINRYSLKGKLSPQCVACCPVNKDLVAIGTKSGLFIVYSFQNSGSVLWSLRGHDSEIVSVAWCPANEKQQNEDNNSDSSPLVVASASKDCTVTIWKDKVSEFSFNLVPVNRNSSVQGIRHVCICWPVPNTLVAGTHQGDLKLLKLPGDPRTELKGTRTNVVDIPVKHNKCVFALTSTPVIGDPAAGGDATPPVTVWSASIDRNIIGFNLSNPKKQIIIPTLSQIVYCMAFNPLNNAQLAMGIGNGEVLVWNVSTKSSFDTVCYKNKIMAKVMALAWHPTAENLLAFGTGEGRVGIINTTSKTAPVILKLAHSSSVYTLSWAPPLNYLNAKLKNGLSLYSVGNGEIVEHNPDDPFANPSKLNKMLSTIDESFGLNMRFQRTELAWNHDFSALAVGNENGYVHILDEKWQGVQTLYAHKKIIQSLSWHPKIISDDSMEQSTPWKNVLATASHQIKVYDFSDGLDKEPKVIVTFSHADDCRVTTVAWSPFIPYRLLTTSYDNSAQIWDVLNKTPLANFPGHTGYVMCGLWSPLEHELAYTGGADCKVFVWKTSNQPYVKPIERKKRKEMSNKYQLTNVTEAKYGNVNFNAEPVSPEQNNGTNIVEKNKKIVPKLKTLFVTTAPHLSEGKAFGDLISVKKSLENKSESDSQENGKSSPEPSEPSYLQFFSDRNSMVNLLTSEQNKHTAMQNLDGEQFCRFWKGDISALVRDSIHKKQMSEWILALAPMASYKLWLEACAAFAYQIALDQPLRAASYLIAANQIDEAVNILIGKNMHREAVAIAKCHYAANDTRIENLMKSWAEFATSHGHFSLAAHCYYSINDKASAMKSILKCKDPKLRYQAAILAEGISTPLVVDDIVTDCFIDCLSNNQIINASNILGERTHLNHLAVWLQTYKHCSQNIIMDWQHEKNWLCQGLDNLSLLKDLDNLLKETSKTDKESVYQKLSKIVDSINVENRSKLIMYVSGQLALLMSTDINSVKLNHLVNVFSSCYKFQIQNPPYHYAFSLSMLLCPQGPQKFDAFLEEHFQISSESSSKVITAVQSLNFYLSAALVLWLKSAANLLPDAKVAPNEDSTSASTKVGCNKVLEPEHIVNIFKHLQSLVERISKSNIISYYKETLPSETSNLKLFTFYLGDSVKLNGIPAENPEKLVHGGASEVKVNGSSENESDICKRQLQTQHISVPDPLLIFSTFKSILGNSQFVAQVQSSEPQLLPKMLSEVECLWNGLQPAVSVAES